MGCLMRSQAVQRVGDRLLLPPQPCSDGTSTKYKGWPADNLMERKQLRPKVLHPGLLVGSQPLLSSISAETAAGRPVTGTCRQELMQPAPLCQPSEYPAPCPNIWWDPALQKHRGALSGFIAFPTRC